ncbi:uncharacterized protein L969DRAFT_96421 [Mixia osmundae IAM 14324]|uniref:Uncharacterized protein n=1 Tax=Mixia osmundae (strain CBS 9802 / IAM 14324 / JCM 22182 / KY 12970) TaxID=764103 RepID=G7DWI0_MIXOS|nr:uncharacterized protein L969DRAFT_96421 [Mixia osmundae IAM 14324]KEI37342.1 hypothetical protein L969DRAFT_96421 [Mixia osmundae IAM 14324]GAA94940.1 hypothetical protein E5Q_01595 [Mixia osmundae IAM 14324]
MLATSMPVPLSQSTSRQTPGGVRYSPDSLSLSSSSESSKRVQTSSPANRGTRTSQFVQNSLASTPLAPRRYTVTPAASSASTASSLTLVDGAQQRDASDSPSTAAAYKGKTTTEGIHAALAPSSYSVWKSQQQAQTSQARTRFEPSKMMSSPTVERKEPDWPAERPRTRFDLPESEQADTITSGTQSGSDSDVEAKGAHTTNGSVGRGALLQSKGDDSDASEASPPMRWTASAYAAHASRIATSVSKTAPASSTPLSLRQQIRLERAQRREAEQRDEQRLDAGREQLVPHRQTHVQSYLESLPGTQQRGSPARLTASLREPPSGSSPDHSVSLNAGTPAARLRDAFQRAMSPTSPSPIAMPSRLRSSRSPEPIAAASPLTRSSAGRELGREPVLPVRVSPPRPPLSTAFLRRRPLLQPGEKTSSSESEPERGDDDEAGQSLSYYPPARPARVNVGSLPNHASARTSDQPARTQFLSKQQQSSAESEKQTEATDEEEEESEEGVGAESDKEIVLSRFKFSTPSHKSAALDVPPTPHVPGHLRTPAAVVTAGANDELAQTPPSHSGPLSMPTPHAPGHYAQTPAKMAESVVDTSAATSHEPSPATTDFIGSSIASAPSDYKPIHFKPVKDTTVTEGPAPSPLSVKRDSKQSREDVRTGIQQVFERLNELISGLTTSNESATIASEALERLSKEDEIEQSADLIARLQSDRQELQAKASEAAALEQELTEQLARLQASAPVEPDRVPTAAAQPDADTQSRAVWQTSLPLALLASQLLFIVAISIWSSPLQQALIDLFTLHDIDLSLVCRRILDLAAGSVAFLSQWSKEGASAETHSHLAEVILL